MDRLLRPERLDTDPNSTSAAQEWTHWLKTFQNFLAVLPGDDVNRLSVLTNYISPKIYGSIADCTTYEQAIAALTALYVKPSNEIFARHCSATRRQKPGENLDEFLQALKILSKDCIQGCNCSTPPGRGNPRCLYQWLTIINYSSAFT